MHYRQTCKQTCKHRGVLKKGDWGTSNKKCERPHKRKKLRCFQVLRTLPLCFKYSTFMTHIHASNRANKKFTIRDKRKFGMFLSFKDSTWSLWYHSKRKIYVQTQTGHLRMRNLCRRDHLKREIYIQTQTGHSRMRNLHERDHSKRDIYIHTQIGHSRMRNLCQRDHSAKQFTSKHKQTTQEWAI